MNARCPNCDDGLGERRGTYTENDTVVAEFECSGCDHEWSVPV